MQSKFENVEFQELVERIRKIMPLLAVVLLVTVYVISAAAAGKFLAHPTLLGALPNGALLAFSIGAAIQATRALLVFFRQLNPTRPTLGHTGEFIAAGMGALSIYEISHLAGAAGMGFPVVLSLSVLMLAGVGVEIFLLSELRFYTEMELYRDKAYWAQIESYYQAKADFQRKVRAIRKGHTNKPITNTLEAKPGTTIEASPKPVVHEVAIPPFPVNGNGKHIAGTVAGH
jgi:uncharacterized membrane protein (DUF485 family)